MKDLTQSAFNNWLEELDKLLNAKIGLSLADLDDSPTFSYFAAGMTPETANTALIVNYEIEYNPKRRNRRE